MRVYEEQSYGVRKTRNEENVYVREREERSDFKIKLVFFFFFFFS